MDIASLEQKSVEVSGCRITYVEMGEDRGNTPILLLHGGGPGAGGTSNYIRNIGPLSERFGRVIVPDMPGFGSSENKIPPGNYTGLMGAYGDIVMGFMDQLGIKQADMVGNSMGGGECLSIALKKPEYIRKMVLMGTGGMLAMHTPFPTEGNRRMSTFYAGEGPTEAKMRGVLELLVHDQSVITDELVKIRVEQASRPDVVANPMWAQYGLDPFWKEPLWTIEHETLILWGKEDRINPVDGYMLFSKMMPNCEVHLMPNCGHWVQWEKADAFNGIVGEFFAR